MGEARTRLRTDARILSTRCDRSTSTDCPFRRHYTDLSGWTLFEDSRETLSSLSALGYRLVLLSSHVPGLPKILNHLGLNRHFKAVFNSAVTGYEKPHPEAFRLVERALLVRTADEPGPESVVVRLHALS